MAQTSLNIHVNEEDQLIVRSSGLVGPGSVPTLSFTVSGNRPGYQPVNLDLFLWGDPAKVIEELDDLVAAATALRSIVMARA